VYGTKKIVINFQDDLQVRSWAGYILSESETFVTIKRTKGDITSISKKQIINVREDKDEVTA
jgi:hypothetical protein